MFGRMMVSPVLEFKPNTDMQTAVAALLTMTEQPEVARWIEFPASLLLFLLVPGDPDSGATYILDRRKGVWYAVDFADEQFGGYSVSQLETLLQECGFLELVEQPGLWRNLLPWLLEPGKRPEVRV